MWTIWVFDINKNKHSPCCGEDFMKNFCSSLKEHATYMISFEKKKTLSLTKRLKLHQDSS